MANRVVTRQFRGRVGPRRSTDWIASTVETAVSSLAAASVVLDQSFAFSEDATIVRVRGMLWVASDQAIASEEPFGAVGFATVTGQANAVGVTAVPTPIADQPSEQFFLWAPFMNDLVQVTGAGFAARTFRQVPLESKAMRKVTQGQAVVVTLENSSAVAGMEYLMLFRMLIKLH